MSLLSPVRGWWGAALTIGSQPDESDVRRGQRHILVGYLVAGTLARVLGATFDLSQGLVEGWVNGAAAVASAALAVLLWFRPSWFVGIANAALAFILVEVLSSTVFLGGFFESNMVILFGLLAVVGSLTVLRVVDGVWWMVAFAATVALGAILPSWIEPLEVAEGTPGDTAVNVVFAVAFAFWGMSHFVRQRDRYQTESDDLLHNILPDDVARRLKMRSGLIADDYAEASVLFADVVDFTPLSATLSPPELVGLLNAVFTRLDGFVDELGLEKIKTVGDAYMVASGVPEPRADHAYAIAELALRIRDCTASEVFEGYGLRMRIGINSGPVVAGIVGTHKFAYDLWGDVVNTASRMESTGIPGEIQLTDATRDLIHDRYVCEPRGVISVKGKGDMHTFLLVGPSGG